MKRGNKKGQNMSVGTIIAIVILLVLAVLVILQLVFGIDILGLQSQQRVATNADTAAQICDEKCRAGSVGKYEFCCVVRDVVFDKDQENPDSMTCIEDSRIGQGGCDKFQCDKLKTCEAVLCKSNSPVMIQLASSEKDKCNDAGKEQITSFTLDSSGNAITYGQVCCMAYDPVAVTFAKDRVCKDVYFDKVSKTAYDLTVEKQADCVDANTEKIFTSDFPMVDASTNIDTSAPDNNVCCGTKQA